MFNWTKVTFLESPENLKTRLEKLTGRTPTMERVREVSICLQQGRLFYQSAAESSLEIRPLLLFYGTMAFARALIVGFNQTPLASLSQAHGVKDISSQNCGVSDLKVKIQNKGTFQGLNDIAARLNRVDYIDETTMYQHFMAPTVTADKIADFELSLKEILSRIPGLGDIYKRTFTELPNSVPVRLSAEIFNRKCWELHIATKEIFRDREGLAKIVGELRGTFPLLSRLSVSRASPAWNASYIYFSNMPVPDNEFAEKNLPDYERGFQTKHAMSHDDTLPYTPFQGLIGPHEGSFADSSHLVRPFQGVYFSKISLHYLGMFLLSSLVRYRPQVWGYAITRLVRPDGKIDDYILSLLEEFMKLHEKEMPAFVAGVFDPDE